MSTSRAVKPPLKFSVYLGEVIARCPEEFAAYGGCIAKNIGDVQKGTCAKEFAALSQCSATTLAHIRGKR